MEEGWRSVDYIHFDFVHVKCAEIFCRSGGWDYLQEAYKKN
jgi:hypothetical protein